jgi:hypothetical protein
LHRRRTLSRSSPCWEATHRPTSSPSKLIGGLAYGRTGRGQVPSAAVSPPMMPCWPRLSSPTQRGACVPSLWRSYPAA